MDYAAKICCDASKLLLIIVVISLAGGRGAMRNQRSRWVTAARV